MRQRFVESGFRIEAIRSVSYYRIPLLKKVLPANWLAALDGWTQPTGRWFQYSPSIFLKAVPVGAAVEVNSFFKCPICGQAQLQPEAAYLICLNCDVRWGVKDGIYDFKTPLNRID
jgi:hypothetical protein